MTRMPPADSDPAPDPAPAKLTVPWHTLLTLFAGSRLLIWLVAGLSLSGVNKGPHFTPTAGPLDWFIRWDSAWYLELARHGYYFTADGAPTNVVFLPLYSALIRIVSLNGLLPLAAIAHIISLACLWLACVWLWRLVAREWRDPQLATTAVAFLLFGPVSFFFSIPYSEALFLPLVIGCLAFAREGRWWLAGALGALAAGTRFVGLALIAPLAWEYVCSHERERVEHAPFRLPTKFGLVPLLACVSPIIGFGLYALAMWIQFGDPLIYFRGQLHWGGETAWFWDFLARPSFSGLPDFYQLWFGGTVFAAFGLLALGVWFRVPTTYLVFGLALGGVYISSRFAAGVPRYFSVVFPLYIVAALLARRWPSTTIPLLGTSAALLALSVTLFVNGYWFT